ncbi:hypothetical protein NPIL_294531 [Nephila pilipes]|uniref:Uncharacterized protein n=1 Tax=Nephila pilipes TaxID=299642 RepID=A0A8X6UKF1_NEPPI|nr:hypothetical protein NPIL_294531 [Nephila pilipes]
MRGNGMTLSRGSVSVIQTTLSNNSTKFIQFVHSQERERDARRVKQNALPLRNMAPYKSSGSGRLSSVASSGTPRW